MDFVETGRCATGAIDIDTVKEQHVEMNIQVQGTVESLDQCDRTRAG